MDFEELHIDGLMETGALSSAISETDIGRNRLLAPHTNLTEGFSPEFQIMVVNGHLEATIATVGMQFKVSGSTVREKNTVLTNLMSSLIGLLFLQLKSNKLDMCQGTLKLSCFSMQLKKEDRAFSNVTEPILKPVEILLQPGKRTTNWIISQIYTDSEATGIIHPLLLLESVEDFLNCLTVSTTPNKTLMVQIRNFLGQPHTLKNETHIANFPILIPEQTKHIRHVNHTLGYHLLNINNDDVFCYTNSPLETSEPTEVNETYWFPTPQNLGNETEQTPTQKRIFNRLRELEEVEQLNPQDNINSRT